ncbi:MAG: 16S rRNA (cytidine(1402)-2'-O)-methyltransferase [Candidatus Pacebacteria bacterium]|jgi:16S rRNA (cytidine1402-2'-O)-methyltransferase|nr:16S rRNA (cytidine(1402)-2'-O)-methyltransferase [Candidatus Paceibacterota bacterium]
MAETKIGTLFIVATPIGNMEDITLRALRVLREVDYVLCEDTRTTGYLLKHHGVRAKMLKRYDAHASETIHDSIVADLVSGQSIALVSDAGTPGVSDPGVMLVRQARAAGCRVDAVPGPSAVTAAISIAGINGNQFSFLGFVPSKKGRETFFTDLELYDHPVVFLEATHRILKTLQSLAEHYATATVHLGRELTKFHEEMLVGTPAEVLTVLTETPVKQKGEFVLVLTGQANVG